MIQSSSHSFLGALFWSNLLWTSLASISKVTLIQLLLSFYHKYNHVEFMVLGDYVELQTATKMHKIGTHCSKYILANPFCCNW